MTLRRVFISLAAPLLTTSFGFATSGAPFFDFIEAVDRGEIKTVKTMINARVDVNRKLRSGATSLMLASAKDHTNMVRLLIKKGADINAIHNTGDTALTLASSYGYVEAVRTLVLSGADQNLKNRIGTPMKIASIVRRLLNLSCPT